MGAEGKVPRFAVFIVAYNAITTVTKVLDRIPPAIWDQVEEVFVFDDCSKDETTLLAHGYKNRKNVEKLNVYRNEMNLGYGGNQKKGYRYAMEKGYDYVILLHGDGQYAPEALGDFIAAAKRGRPAMVVGSRMMNKRDALRGGMPYYKFLGNIVLTGFENWMLHSSISEFHSGYRMYSVEVLKKLHLDRYTDDFHFDTEIMVELIHRGEKITEIPIPTYYGGEICYVNGMKYAFDVFKSVLQYKLFTHGLAACDWVEPRSPSKYQPKRSPLSSHRRVASAVPSGSEVLDLGAEGNYIEELDAKGCGVWGVTVSDLPTEVRGRYEKLFLSDLEKPGWSACLEGKKFQVAVLADVLEHLRNARSLVSSLKDHLSRDGMVVASTPNIAHFYVRAALLLGLFPYGEKGILDETHVHFYTLRSFRRLFEKEGFVLVRRSYTPIPFELFAGKGRAARAFFKLLEYTYYAAVKVWPSLFAYQMVYCFRKQEAS